MDDPDILGEEIDSIDDIRLRESKNDDLGEVLPNEPDKELGNYWLHNNKEFLVQKCDPEALQGNAGSKVNFLVREWRPDTWEFGELREVCMNKYTTGKKMAEHLVANFYPNIDVKNLWGLKLKPANPFIRSDLVLKGWRALFAMNQSLENCDLEISRDSLLVIVKDNSI